MLSLYQSEVSMPRSSLREWTWKVGKDTLQGTITYPQKMAFWVDDFPFPKVGYVNSLEDTILRGSQQSLNLLIQTRIKHVSDGAGCPQRERPEGRHGSRVAWVPLKVFAGRRVTKLSPKLRKAIEWCSQKDLLYPTYDAIKNPIPSMYGFVYLHLDDLW